MSSADSWPADPWPEFCAAAVTHEPSPGIRQTWARGRPTYTVWALRIEDERVTQRVARVRQAIGVPLTDIPNLHVTAWVAGFPARVPELDDDIALDVLEAQSRSCGPVRIQVGPATSFLGCPALLVGDPHGELARGRSALSAHGRELRWAAYQPHITVGTYGVARPTGPLVERLRPLRELPPFELSAPLMRLDIDAASGATTWR